MKKVLLIIGAVALLGLIAAAITVVRNRRRQSSFEEQTQTSSQSTLSLKSLVDTSLNFAAIDNKGEQIIYIESDTNVVKQYKLTDGSATTIARIPKALSPVNVVWSADLSFGLIDALELGKNDRQFYLLNKGSKEMVKLDPKIVAANFIGSSNQYLAQKLTDGGSELLLVDPSSGVTSTIGQLGAEPRVIRPLIGDRAVLLPNTKENGREKIIVYEAGKLRDLGIVELGTIDLIPLDAEQVIVDQFDAENLAYQLSVLDIATGKLTNTGVGAQVADTAYQPGKRRLLVKIANRLIAYSLDTNQPVEIGQSEQVASIQKIITIPQSSNILVQINNQLFELSL